MNNIEREEFLEWWESRHYDDEDKEVKKAAWCAWQAARQAPASVEPVGWVPVILGERDYDCFTTNERRVQFWRNECPQWEVQPLYTHPPAKVPEGVDVAVDMLEDYASALGNGDLDGAGHSTTQAIYKVISLLTTPTPATTPETEWVKCHAETAAIALEALHFYADERFKGFGDDPEPYEHHLAQQAISELQELLPAPPQEQ